MESVDEDDGKGERADTGRITVPISETRIKKEKNFFIKENKELFDWLTNKCREIYYTSCRTS